MSKKETVSIGNCGEYFVAAELERNGFTAALPMSGTKDFDVLAISRKSGKQVAVQVKTNHTSQRTWTLSQKAELLSDGGTYYVLVCLNGTDAPDFYVLPSALVAKSVKESHAAWLSGTPKKGGAYKDTSIRKFSFDKAEYNPLRLCAEDYKGKWERLEEGFSLS